jgi:hypothetical protein
MLPWGEKLVSHRIYDNSCPYVDLLKFEDTNGRSRKPKKNRQHNSQKKTYKATNNDPQNIHI